MRPRIAAFAPVVCALLAVSTDAHAQAQRSGGGETQKIIQQYQQLASERTQLQAQLADLKKKLDEANSALAAVKKERDGLKAHPGVSPTLLAEANAGKESAEKNLEQSKARMNELIARFRDMAQTLKDTELDRNKARQEIAAIKDDLGQCAMDNAQLAELSSQVLNRYEHVGLFTRASADEPFTQIARTRIQNYADEYREKAEQLKVKKAAPAPVPSP
jgi:septal ring factor EnvC (AmiA/AmiB activator)